METASVAAPAHPTGASDANSQSGKTVGPTDSWKGLALVLIMLVFAAGSILGLWAWGEREPNSDVAAYWPVSNGVSTVSRVTAADGSISYAGSNATDERASALIRDAHYLLLGSIVDAAGGDLVGDQAVLDLLGRTRVSRVRDVMMAGSLVTATESLMLALPQQMALVQLTSGNVTAIFNPPVALLRSGQALASSQVQTGLVSYPAYSATLTYTATLTFETAEPVQVPAGAFDDCQRVLLSLQIGRTEASGSRAWYCRGFGNVKQVDLDAQGVQVREFEAVSLQSPNRISTDAGGITLPPARTWTFASTPRVWPVAASDVLTELWRSGEGDGVATVMAEPVIVEGLDLVLITTYRGDVIALNRHDGSRVWRYRAGGPVYGAPVVHEGVAYFGAADRRVYAIDVQTGTYRWSFATRDSVSSSPTVADGVLYVGSQDRMLYALELASGRLLRRFDVGGAISTTPLVADGTVYVGSDDGAVYALNAADFSVRWAYAAGNAVAASPLLIDGVLYIATHGHTLLALDAATTQAEGALLWEFQTRNAASANLLKDNGTLYLPTTDALYAIDIATHTARWRYADATLYGTPIIMKDILIAQSSAGVVALDLATGTQRRVTRPVESSPNAGLSTDGQRIYVGYFDGIVLALGSPDAVMPKPEPRP